MLFMIVNDLLTNKVCCLMSHHLSKAMQIIVGHVINLKTVDEEFMSLVKYIIYKLLEQDN